VTAQIKLSGGHIALVDAADFDRLAAMAWHASPHGRTVYARTNLRQDGKFVTVPMHRIITGWLYIDHINGDGLDNRRVNLRQATHGQNMGNKRIYSNNTSGYKGVGLHRLSSKWQAMIQRDGKAHYLGRYATPEEAARAYDRAAIEVFGEFARLNFPQEV
jgi:hypothetical protein